MRRTDTRRERSFGCTGPPHDTSRRSRSTKRTFCTGVRINMMNTTPHNDQSRCTVVHTARPHCHGSEGDQVWRKSIGTTTIQDQRPPASAPGSLIYGRVGIKPAHATSGQQRNGAAPCRSRKGSSSGALCPARRTKRTRRPTQHANLAAAASLIQGSRLSFCRVPPGSMRSIHTHK